MSGWIKFEKALREDLRVKRMAVGIADRFACNGTPLQRSCAVTVVLGGLAQLWMHADTFARDDDTLAMSAHEIDELTGIEGFAQLMPPDWLQILDAECVKLPGFQGHNGVVAKGRALGAKRVSKHRSKNCNGATLPQRPACNAAPLPDQTRPDHTRQDQKERARRQAPPDFAITADMRAWGQKTCPEVDLDSETARFRDHEFARPHSNWPAAWRNWMRRCGQFAPVNGRARPPGKSLVELEDLEIRRLVDAGKSAQQIADEVQVPLARVQLVMERARV